MNIVLGKEDNAKHGDNRLFEIKITNINDAKINSTENKVEPTEKKDEEKISNIKAENNNSTATTKNKMKFEDKDEHVTLQMPDSKETKKNAAQKYKVIFRDGKKCVLLQ